MAFSITKVEEQKKEENKANAQADAEGGGGTTIPGVDISKDKQCPAGFHFDEKQQRCVPDKTESTPAIPGAQKFFLPGSDKQVTREEFNAFIARTGQRNIAGGQITPAVQRALDKTFPSESRSNELLEQIPLEQEQLPITEQEKQVDIASLTDPETRAEAATDFAANIGLVPIAKIAGAITEGLDALGIVDLPDDFEPLTAAELADKPFGKAIGITTAAAGTTALIAGASVVLGGYVATATAGLASALGVSKGAILAAGGIGASVLTGFNQDLIVDKILDREEAQEIQGAINTMGQRAPTIAGLVEAGFPAAEGLARLNLIERDLNILAARAKQATIKDERILQSGQYADIMGDVIDQREIIEENRLKILNTIPELNPTALVTLIKKMQLEQDEQRKQFTDPFEKFSELKGG